MSTITFTKTAAPEWLLAMWKEIDDKTFGKGFDCKVNFPLWDFKMYVLKY